MPEIWLYGNKLRFDQNKKDLTETERPSDEQLLTWWRFYTVRWLSTAAQGGTSTAVHEVQSCPQSKNYTFKIKMHCGTAAHLNKRK